MSQNLSTKPVEDVKHKAVDTSIVLGSLYDARRGCILRGDRVSVLKKESSSSTPPYCVIQKGSVDGSFNLHEFIDIHDELSLNLLLNITKRVGIASVMNYARRINEYTRFLYYSWVTRNEQLGIITDTIRQNFASVDPQFVATHVVASIDFGIDVIVVLQLPSEVDVVSKIDHMLQKIRNALLNNNEHVLTWNSEEKSAVEKIVHVTTYSNMPCLTSINYITNFLKQIIRTKKNSTYSHPVTYYFRPTRWLNSFYVASNATLKVLPREINEQIEQHLIQLRNSLQYIEASFNEQSSHMLYGDLPNRIYDAHQEWSTLKTDYIKIKKQISVVLTDSRCGRCDVIEIFQKLRSDEAIKLQNDINRLTQIMRDIEKMSVNLNRRQATYYNEPERLRYENNNIKHNDYHTRANAQYDDEINKNYASNNTTYSKPNNSYQSSYDKSRYTQEAYSSKPANTNTSSQMQDIIISKSSHLDDNGTTSNEDITTPIDIEQNLDQFRLLPKKTDDTINILLLGETGVGKSTFINAFANYLNFDSLDQAQCNKPVVLIPVSFTMTVGNDFEERSVTFGDIDNLNNENFEHPGQSVTQHCKSYIFYLGDGTKISIIDTPGFGDTRGIEQDNRNMQHTIEYINNLTHIDAVCFLLKPNITRLNIFFRTCLNELINFLGPHACKNLVFCFTNARSTFYAPGNTAPLLKSMFQSLSMNDIPFTKCNTFCFDSESFRYLVALQNDIPLDDTDKSEYETSWKTSVNESERFIKYIRTKLTENRIQGGWQSIKHAQFEILHMIRPLLEAMKNILCNMILWDKDSRENAINIYPKVIHRPATLCLSCKLSVRPVGNFWVTEDQPHEIHHNGCLLCNCPSNEHMPIDYIVDYRLVYEPSKYQKAQILDQLTLLCDASAAFSYFLMNIARCTKDDPILNGLMQMIINEQKICSQLKPNHLNYELFKDLMKLQEKYEKTLKGTVLNQNYKNLNVIYQWIEKVIKNPLIQPQISVIKLGQQIMMKQYEFNLTQI